MHERKNTSEKAKRILRNNAINDAYRENRLLKKEINTSRTIPQCACPLEYNEIADFIFKQFERHRTFFFMQGIFFYNLYYPHPILIASTNKLIFWKLNLMMTICKITNSPKNIEVKETWHISLSDNKIYR